MMLWMPLKAQPTPWAKLLLTQLPKLVLLLMLLVKPLVKPLQLPILLLMLPKKLQPLRKK